MKLLYLHGLASGGQSATVNLLRKLLPEIEIIAPDIPVNAREALEMLKVFSKSLSADDIIVGTSMGAFYAQLMRGWRRILVNPSFHTSEAVLRPNFGKTMPFFCCVATECRNIQSPKNYVGRLKMQKPDSLILISG